MVTVAALINFTETLLPTTSVLEVPKDVDYFLPIQILMLGFVPLEI